MKKRIFFVLCYNLKNLEMPGTEMAYRLIALMVPIFNTPCILAFCYEYFQFLSLTSWNLVPKLKSSLF